MAPQAKNDGSNLTHVQRWGLATWGTSIVFQRNTLPVRKRYEVTSCVRDGPVTRQLRPEHLQLSFEFLDPFLPLLFITFKQARSKSENKDQNLTPTPDPKNVFRLFIRNSLARRK